MTHSRRPKNIAFFLLRISAVPYFIREVVQRRRATILVYHKLSPEVADRHFEALRRSYNIISLADYLDARTNRHRQLPPKALIITLDDGHKGNYALKPVLEKYGITATVFLCSGLADTNRHFWFEIEMSNSVRQGLKGISDEERLKVLAGMGFRETAEQTTRQALSASEIEDMKLVVDFQSHTVDHPVLPQCSDQRAFHQLSDSKIKLEDKFGLRIYALAYPNGDYSAREIAAAEKCGYQCALTLDLGFNSRTTPAFQLKRICINDDAGLDELFVRASGLWGFLRNLVRRRSPHGSDLPRVAAADCRRPDYTSVC
jgi:peptidoglycan/xylan/chitin deacetylase (PgdA/CDA1 family)